MSSAQLIEGAPRALSAAFLRQTAVMGAFLMKTAVYARVVIKLGWAAV